MLRMSQAKSTELKATGMALFSAGRSCPLSYRYSPAKLRALPSTVPPQQSVLVIGGLYGNEQALHEVFSMAACEKEATGISPLLIWLSLIHI